MNIGEYRTDGVSVAYRRDASTCLVWAEGESVSTVWMTTGAEYSTWRTMPSDEVTLWRGGAPPLGWQERAEKAEAALADAKTTADLVRASTQAQFDREMAACAAAGVPWDGADTVERLAGVIARVRGALNPDIVLTNGSMQAGYRAAAAAVAKALGDK